MSVIGVEEGARWPTASSYVDAVQHPSRSFTHDLLRSGRIATGAFGLPRASTGQRAVVFRLDLPDAEPLALRCWLADPGAAEARYTGLAQHTERLARSPLLETAWISGAVRVGGAHWPALTMGWAAGVPLNVAVGGHVGDADWLNAVADRFAELVQELAACDLAHGDLQHGNVLADESGHLQLVDYDSVWAPGIDHLGCDETGHPHYQHPQRIAQEVWNRHVDTFPALVIYTSLRALAVDEQLWALNRGDNLLLTDHDLANPGRTQVWDWLASSPDPDVRDLVELLRQSCTHALHQRSFGQVLDQGVPADAPPWPVAAEQRPAWWGGAAGTSTGWWADEAARAGATSTVGSAETPVPSIGEDAGESPEASEQVEPESAPEDGRVDEGEALVVEVEITASAPVPVALLEALEAPSEPLNAGKARVASQRRLRRRRVALAGVVVAAGVLGAATALALGDADGRAPAPAQTTAPASAPTSTMPVPTTATSPDLPPWTIPGSEYDAGGFRPRGPETGPLHLDLPGEWGLAQGGAGTLGGRPSEFVVVAPDLHRFANGWGMPGARAEFADTLVPDSAEAVLGPIAETRGLAACAALERTALVSDNGIEVATWIYRGCGGTTTYNLLMAHRPGTPGVGVLHVAGTGDADDLVYDRIVFDWLTGFPVPPAPSTTALAASTTTVDQRNDVVVGTGTTATTEGTTTTTSTTTTTTTTTTSTTTTTTTTTSTTTPTTLWTPPETAPPDTTPI